MGSPNTQPATRLLLPALHNLVGSPRDRTKYGYVAWSPQKACLPEFPHLMAAIKISTQSLHNQLLHIGLRLHLCRQSEEDGEESAEARFSRESINLGRSRLENGGKRGLGSG